MSPGRYLTPLPAVAGQPAHGGSCYLSAIEEATHAYASR
jgi:hypothetical protein